MRRLLGHLAQFSSFSRQGELLCTQGLACLLEHPDAHSAFLVFLRQRLASAGDLEPDSQAFVMPLVWRAEASQPDRGRPDLEARCGDSRPRIKIEAKLNAPLGDGQLRSYLDDFARNECDGALLVVVPERRRLEAVATAASHLGCQGDAPWRIGTGPTCSVTVVSWEDLLSSLASISAEPFAGDLANFGAMYRVLNGDDLEPVKSRSELKAWREREGIYFSLVDQVTRRLTASGKKVLPFTADNRSDPNSYQMRYVCPDHSCYSIGVCDGFQGYDTPIWMRFHKNTPHFAAIRERLRQSALTQRLVESRGHVWIPLELPLNATAPEMTDSLMEQAQAVVRVAFPN